MQTATLKIVAWLAAAILNWTAKSVPITPEREVYVEELSLLRYAPPEIDLHIRCGKGTYIRSIANDLGEALAIPAHLSSLRRTRIGRFHVDDAVDVFRSDARAALEPLEVAIEHLPSATLSEDAERRLRMGQQAALHQIEVPLDWQGPLRLMDDRGRLVAIAEAAPGRLALSRVFAPA